MPLSIVENSEALNSKSKNLDDSTSFFKWSANNPTVNKTAKPAVKKSDVNQDIKPTATQNLATGIVAALADVLVTHPLWTVKTLQQQGMKSGEIFRAFGKHPFLAYNGVAANATTMLPLTTGRIFLSAEFEEWLSKDERKPSDGELLASSFVAGSLSSMIGAPTELIRTIKLKQAVLEPQAKGQGFSQITAEFVKKNGVKQLSNGMLTIAMRDGSYTAAFFAGAPLLKEKLSPYFQNNVINSLVSYSIASITASLGNHPFDTIKTLQHTAMAMRHIVNSEEKADFISACKKIIEKDGYSGFWKGYPPRGLRFLIGLMVKASCIEALTNHWEQQNQLAQERKE